MNKTWVLVLIILVVIIGTYFVFPKPVAAPLVWQDITTTNYAITHRELTIPGGKTFQDVLINDVMFDASGMHPKSFNEFQLRHLGTHDFYYIKTGLFEGVLSINYYLVTDNKIDVFTLVSHGVDWTNPQFDPEQDPGHLKLKELLSTL